MPKLSDSTVIARKSYSLMSYTRGINPDLIKSVTLDILDIPDVLINKSKVIIEKVAQLASLTFGQETACAFSKAYAWKITLEDGKPYTYVALICSASVETSKWGIKEGITCTAGVTMIFEQNSPVAPPKAKSRVDEPAARSDLEEM